jgi:hypothetical protein
VVLEVSSKLGRRFLQRPAVALDAADWDQLPDRFGISLADHAERDDLVTALRTAIAEELTDRQRQVFTAIVVQGVPLDALVAQMGSSRNAICKTMFDARRKLRLALAAVGYLTSPAREARLDRFLQTDPPTLAAIRRCASHTSMSNSSFTTSPPPRRPGGTCASLRTCSAAVRAWRTTKACFWHLEKL